MNNDMVEKMNETLDLIPEVLDANDIAELKDEQLQRAESSAPAGDLQKDIEDSRESYQNLMKKGQTALEDMMHVAKATDNPRAFEVVGQLIKITSEVTGELIKLQKDVKDIESKDSSDKYKDPKNVQNNLFVGSTSELQNLLKQMNDNNANM